MRVGDVDPGMLWLLEQWEPRLHCTNCRQARVSGDPDDPDVHCWAGQGGRLKLVKMLRRSHARQFAVAERCADYESMGEEA